MAVRAGPVDLGTAAKVQSPADAVTPTEAKSTAPPGKPPAEDSYERKGSPPRELWGSKGPRAEDVMQGSTGDCWLLGTLQAFALDNPDALKHAVAFHPDGSGAGRADVMLRNVDGSTEKVSVPLPPARAPNPAPLSPHWAYRPPGVGASEHVWSDQRRGANGAFEAWPGVFEQAVSTYAGRHFAVDDPNRLGTATGPALDGGHPSDAFRLLTGKAGKQTFWNSPASPGEREQTWTALRGAGHGTPTIAWTKEAASDGQLLLPNGLVASHVYAVVSADHGADGARTVTVRNTIGTDFASKGGRIPDVRIRGAQARPNGELKIPFDAFLANFSGVGRAG